MQTRLKPRLVRIVAEQTGELITPVRAAVDEAVKVVESLVAELAAEFRSTRKVVGR